MFGGQFSEINNKISEMLRTARADGNASQEASILKAIKRGFKLPYGTNKPSFTGTKGTAEFFKVNDRKLNALIKATTNDMEKAEHAVLRMSNDKYRKAIFNAQVYANAGGATYEKAVDMACKDMLMAGLNCVEYKNGARHTLSDYADMAVRTANKRAYLQGEGEKRKEWGVTTVIINKRTAACPRCTPFCGKVFIDDVWSGGSSDDGSYPLLSSAIVQGLYHPRCRDSHTTYFEGISEPPADMTRAEQDKVNKEYEQQQKAAQAQNMENKCNRISKYSLDKDNKRVCQARADEWQSKAEMLNETVAKSADGGIIGVKNFAKASDVFNYSEVVGKITPDFVTSLLESNEIGLQTIEMLKEKSVKPILDYEYHNFTHRGEQQGRNIKIFMKNIPSVKVAAQTVIHETTHLYFDIGQCQWAEAVCFAREKMFLTGRKLTISELKYIINLTKQAYPEFKWKKGGYGYGKRFN